MSMIACSATAMALAPPLTATGKRAARAPVEVEAVVADAHQLHELRVVCARR